MIDLNEFCFCGSLPFDISAACTDSGASAEHKKELVEATGKNLEIIHELQSKIFAEAREGVLICLQALDAAGKDSLIKHVLSGINPLGINIYNYRTPTPEEASHDFLWRYHKNLPSRGKIAVFNRSYYEEVLVVKVHDVHKSYKVPFRMMKGDYFKKKYKDICSWEKYLYGNGTRIIKIFLNVSKEKQKKRFLERIERPEKHWKFSANDINERAYFEQYRQAFEQAINGTSTRICPWYVLPADDKWYTRYLFSEILVKELTAMAPKYPSVCEEHSAVLADCRERLVKE